MARWFPTTAQTGHECKNAATRVKKIIHHSSFIIYPTRLLISRRRLAVATGSTWPALSKTTP